MTKWVTIKNDYDDFFHVADTDVERALDTGEFRLATPEEEKIEQEKEKYGRGLAPVKAAALEAANALTFGGAGLALEKTGLLPIEEQELYKEYNPVSTLAGGAAGMLLPMGPLGVGVRALEKGAASAASKLASTSAMKSLASRGVRGAIVAKGAEKAVEGQIVGGVYGAGTAISDAIAHDQELSSELLIPHIQSAILLGGGVGGTLGASGAAIGAGLKRLGTFAPKNALTKPGLKEDLSARAFGLTGTNIRSLQKSMNKEVPETLGQIGKAVDEFKFEDGSKIIQKFNTAEQNTKRLGEAVDIVGEKVSERINELDSVLKESGESFDMPGVLKQVDAKVIKPLMQSDIPDFNDLGKRLNKSLRTIRKKISPPKPEPVANEGLLEGYTTSAGEEIVPEIQKEIKPYKYGLKEAWNLRRDFDDLIWGRGVKGAGVRTAKPHAYELRQFRNILEDSITNQIDRALPALDDEATLSYKKAKELYSMLKPLHDEAIKRQAIIQGNNAISLTDYLAAGSALIGGGMYGIPGAIAAGTIHHFAKTRGPSLLAVGASRLAQPEMATKLQNTIDALVAGTTKRTKETIRNTARVGTAKAIDAMKSKDDDNYQRQLDILSQYVTNPAALTDQVERSMASLENYDPHQVALASTKAVNAVQFLHAKAPKPTGTSTTLTPVADKWKPSKTELAKYYRYRDAVIDPSKTLQDIQNGHLSDEAAEALRAVYPGIHRYMVGQVQERVSQRKNRLSHKERVLLGRLFGSPVDDLQKIDVVRAIQVAFAQNEAAKEQQETRQRRATGQNLDASAASQTRFQRAQWS